MLGGDLAGVPFRWADHAYASVYVVLTATAATFIAISTLMVAALLIQRLVGVVDSGRMLEADVTVLYLWWATARRDRLPRRWSTCCPTPGVLRER